MTAHLLCPGRENDGTFTLSKAGEGQQIYSAQGGRMMAHLLCPGWENDGTYMVCSHQSKTTRQMLNLCIPMMPFTPGPTNRQTFLLSSCSGVKTPSLCPWRENDSTFTLSRAGE